MFTPSKTPLFSVWLLSPQHKLVHASKSSSVTLFRQDTQNCLKIRRTRT